MQTKEEILDACIGKDVKAGRISYKNVLEAMERYASGRGGAKLEWKSMTNPPEAEQLCLFVRRPIVEPPYCGSMIDEDFVMTPDYYTHYAELKNEHFDESVPGGEEWNG